MFSRYIINIFIFYFSEFDKYQVSVNVRQQSRSTTPILKGRDEPTECELSDGLEPGRTYLVLVKTFSGKVASWPAAVNVTLSKFSSSFLLQPIFKDDY